MKHGKIAMATMIVGLVLSAGAAPAHAEPANLQLVRPMLECVSANGDGTYTAVFGTYNPSTSSKDVPEGLLNFVLPIERDRNQPTTFAPGRTVASYSVRFTTNVTWVLDITAVTATPSSQPCNSAPNVSEASMPVLLALMLMVMSGGWMSWQRRRTT